MAYKIKSGDTLSGIAKANNTDISSLLKLNPNITDPNKIYAGQDLNLSSPLITTDQITPTTPIKIPETTGDTTNYPAIVAGSSADLQAQADKAQKSLDEATKAQSDTSNSNSTASQILALMGEQGGLAADTASAYDASGATALSEQLSKLNREAQNLNLENQAKNLALENQGADITVGGLQRSQEANNRETAIKALTLSQQSNIAQGDYLAAKDKADRIISLKYAPIEAKLATLKQQYEFNKDTLTALDKKKTEALAASLKKQEQELADSKAKEQNIQNLMLEVAKNGVTDPDILKSIGSAKTIDEAIQLAAPSLKTTSTDIVKLDNGNTILIDKNTGKVIKSFGGAKPVEGVTSVTESTPEQIKGLASIGSLIGGFSSVNAQKMFLKNVDDLVKKGDERGLAEKVIGQSLANIADGDQRKKATGGFLLSQQLTSLGQLLNDYRAKNGNTNIFKGKIQDINQKLGLVGDPELANIGTQILNQLDNLARTRTGAVISPSEEKLYARLLPSIGKVGELNDAVIKGLKTSLMTDVENNLRFTITTDGLNMVKGTLPELFDHNDTFLNSFSSENINKNLNSQSYWSQFGF